jgi:hypothetical protein
MRILPEPSYKTTGWAIFRLCMVAIFVSQVANMAQLILQTVEKVNAAAGFTTTGITLVNEYQNALATKFAPQDNSNPWALLFNTGQAIGASMFFVIVLILSIIAEVVMYLSTGVQFVALTIELGLAPFFLSFLMVPQMSGIAMGYATGLAATSMWGLAWGISNLVTQVFLGLILNVSNNYSAGSLVTISMGNMFWWLGLALWVIGSTIFAPWILTRQIVTRGSHGLYALGPAVVGLATYALSAATRSAASPAASAATPAPAPPPPNNATWPARP